MRASLGMKALRRLEDAARALVRQLQRHSSTCQCELPLECWRLPTATLSGSFYMRRRSKVAGDLHGSCRGAWQIQARRVGSERQLIPTTPSGLVGELSSTVPQPLDAKPLQRLPDSPSSCTPRRCRRTSLIASKRFEEVSLARLELKKNSLRSSSTHSSRNVRNSRGNFTMK